CAPPTGSLTVTGRWVTTARTVAISCQLLMMAEGLLALMPTIASGSRLISRLRGGDPKAFSKRRATASGTGFLDSKKTRAEIRPRETFIVSFLKLVRAETNVPFGPFR